MKSFFLNASFAFFIGISGTAHADGLGRTQMSPQIAVSYADLDLSREAGARVMLSRLETAASSVCGGWPDLHRLENLTIYRACTRKAMDGAVAQLGSSRVSALYGQPLERLASQH
jgi:UrcA family protein